MPQDKINFIREKCIEAHGGYNENGGTKTYRVYELAAENDVITLADVLLAIPTESLEWNHKKYKLGLRQSFGFKKEPTDWVYWDLKKDLNDQSEETINFIYNLLQ